MAAINVYKRQFVVYNIFGSIKIEEKIKLHKFTELFLCKQMKNVLFLLKVENSCHKPGENPLYIIKSKKRNMMIEILLNLTAGEEQGVFALLWLKYSKKLLRWALMRVDDQRVAEEIVGDAYLILMERYGDKTERELTALLMTVTEHLIHDYWRSSARRNAVCEEEYGDITEEVMYSDVENTVVEEETVRQIEQAVDRLDDKYQSILKMRLFHELSYAEISALLDITESTVRKRYERGRAMVIQTLKKEGIV